MAKAAPSTKQAQRPARSVRTAKLVIDFDPGVYSALRLSPRELATEVRLAAAMHWYSQGLLSQGKASEIAGLSRAAFIDALSQRGIQPLQVSALELDEEVARATAARR